LPASPIFISISIPEQQAIPDEDGPAVAGLVSKPVLFRQAAERSRVIVDAYGPAGVAPSNFGRDALRDENLIAW